MERSRAVQPSTPPLVNLNPSWPSVYSNHEIALECTDNNTRSPEYRHCSKSHIHHPYKTTRRSAGRCIQLPAVRVPGQRLIPPPASNNAYNGPPLPPSPLRDPRATSPTTPPTRLPSACKTNTRRLCPSRRRATAGSSIIAQARHPRNTHRLPMLAQ